MGSPGKAALVDRHRFRGTLFLLIAALILIAAIAATTLAPRRYQEHLESARAGLTELVQPARALVMELRATVDREAAVVRAHLLDRDVGNRDRYREARAREDSILLQLAPLVRRLGAQAVAQLADVRTRALEWHEEQEKLFNSGYAPVFLRRLPAQQARYDQVRSAAERLDATLADLETAREEQIARLAALRSPLLRSVAWIGGVGVLITLLLAWRLILLSARPPRRRLQESERRFSDVAGSIREVFWIIEAEAGRFVYVSPAYELVWGRSPKPLYAGYGNFLATVHPEDRVLVEGATPPSEIEYRIVRPDGTIRWIAERSLLMDSPDAGSSRRLGVAADVTDRVEARQHLTHLALHDPLTGLGNHLLFLDRLEHAVARAKRTGNAVTVILVDVQGFRTANESLEKETGDRILTAVGRRLRRTLRQEDTLVRLGEEAFAAIVEGTEADADAGRAAARVAAAFEMPFSADGENLELSAKVVTAVSNARGMTAADVGRLADEAVHRAREERKRPDVQGRLRQALEKGEFRVLYQPVVDLTTHDLVGLEALLRWEHPDRGLLLPGEFLRLAEASGLIHPIGLWVLRSVCRDLHAWESAAGPLREAWVSVNVSRIQFELPDFVSEVGRILDVEGVLPARLRVEVDESAWFRARQPLQGLRDMGVSVAVDRFAERYGALGALRRLPVDSLKLNRGLGFGRFGRSESSAIVGLASGLGLGVTAVGIETVGELQSLREIGCPYGQGFYFSQALDEEALRGWLARGGPSRAAGVN